MPFKFEKLEVWEEALDYVDAVYSVAARLPKQEEYNLKDQARRAATSIALNIAEGSTGQTDAEFARFLGVAIRSLVETVACQKIMARRGYFKGDDTLRELYSKAARLASRLQALRNAISPNKPWIKEYEPPYDESPPGGRPL